MIKFQIRRRDPNTLIILYKDGIYTFFMYTVLKYFTGTLEEAIIEIDRIRSGKEEVYPIIYNE